MPDRAAPLVAPQVHVPLLNAPSCCREWARVAPTCSIFHQLQPSAVTVTTSSWIMSREIPGHISSVLLWTSRHLKVGLQHHQLIVIPLHASSPLAVSKPLLLIVMVECHAGCNHAGHYHAPGRAWPQQDVEGSLQGRCWHLANPDVKGLACF